MTGIERLREIGNDYSERSWSEAGRGRGMLMLEIADQIERERACDADTIENVRLIVGGVIDDMERHVSGVEGADDSPVARWARELREALGGEEHEPLPEEEAEAIAWVREHGGLDHVKSEWRSRVPYDRYERRRQSLLGHIAECEAALRSRNQRIEELSKLNRDYRDTLNGVCKRLGLTDGTGLPDMPEVIWTELDRRLMPEGMEWPRYESGEPVGFGDEVSRLGEVFSISLYCDGSFALNFRAYSKGERVRRPAKVLDADGVEIRVGDTVWSVDSGTRYTVEKITDELIPIKCRSEMGSTVSLCPSQLTHERPESKCRDCAHWQKDPTADNMGVCWFFYHEYEGQDCYAARRAGIGACEEFMPRASALAERERGE